ncbi:hypothetical protein D3Z36_09690 [Lachnospiraceae bacterium]|nr:hypothetical protein [Lachnospiraceae bacterium]
MENLRWLHLSDFHIGQDNYAQMKLFKSIHKNMKEQKEKGFLPDMIFITGDIANKGKKEEYTIFADEFLLPIVDIYDILPKVYIIPGNHDIDREKCDVAALSLYDVPQKKPIFFDTDEKGWEKRQEIFERFAGFRYGFAMDDFCFPVENIFKKEAYFYNVWKKGRYKVGIAGINTAWLSNSDKDKEKLSVGKWILQEALEKLEECDYKLVLGHHPLNWMKEEQRAQASALLAKYKAIYLHGHMHKNSGGYTIANDSGFLSIQCGAAFQAREDDIYYNSLYWGCLNLAENMVSIMPRRWSASNDRFVLDASDNLSEDYRKEGTDIWEFPCKVFPKEVKQKKKDIEVQVPPNWHLINEEFIKNRKEPEKVDILKYFDGKEPSYNDIFSSYIPLRQIVLDLQKEFIKSNEEDQTKCVLLAAAGGEGKTTILLQTIRELCRENGWQALILRHPEKDIQFHEEQVLKFTQKGNWIIGVDNCFSVAQQIFGLLKKMKRRKYQHIHFLLCARDTDWINSDADKLDWRSVSSFSRPHLKGISEEDAERFIGAWSALGNEGLGKLKGLSAVEAKKRLLQSSQNEEINEPDEGALLGAMLATRYGDELHDHVRAMLRRLEKIPLYHETLLNAFAYIVAMHSEKLFFLSKPVMAQLYSCKEKEVKKNILGPLGDEAASTVSGDMIYTRHGSIAKSARKILDEEFHYDFDEIFIDMTRAAIEAHQKGEYIERLKNWQYISEHFINWNNTLAVRIDREILKLDPYDEYIIVHLSKLYRKVDQPEQAVQLFREVHYVVEDRSFFCEWALTEANVGNKAASICLSAIALSDEVERKMIDVKNAHINLYSIALTFLELYRLYKNETYFSAMASALCLYKKIDSQKKENKQPRMFEQEKRKLAVLKKEKLNLEDDLKEGILMAEKYCEVNFGEGIPKIITLKYQKLFMLGGITI